MSPNSLLIWVQQHPDWLAIAVFLVAFLESLAIAGIIIPGVVLLFGLAAICGGGALALQWTIIAAFLGAVCGDGLSFYLGKYLDVRVRGLWPLSKYPDLLTQGESFFQRHGGKSVIIGRFIGPVRPVIPLVAGMLNMSARRFFAFNLLSALAWAPFYVVPGFLVGAAIDTRTPLPPHFYPVLTVVILVLVSLASLFTQFHYQLRPSGKLYRTLLRFGAKRPGVGRLWSNSYSLRSGVKEYPISSFLLGSCALLLFILWTLLVMNTDAVSHLNAWIAENMQRLHTPILDYLFIGLTLLGDPTFLYIAFGFFGLLLLLQKNLRLMLCCVGAGLVTHAATTGLKHWLQVARPEALLAPESFAYPSGHTSGAVLVYGLATSMLAREFSPPRRWPIYISGAMAALLIAFSRLYLGVHWFSDVVGGALLGLTICGFARVAQSHFDRTPMWRGSWRYVLLFGFVMAACAYLGWTMPETVSIQMRG
ncbi:bifunctional DedA family/phosphatase PAP2 family protein [Hahella aquimaris]|uniref:bifunctional DedA family/phosphatase PAP2 family protein n=1 Tax=Hahella sp. HNIBRBA332 TaxID=3015983 RepID=UPI00273B8525|nr:bifunctional DedA family/phosphatase PAP2 family protein [Hahella sp. HNIBRBA332]WLQ14134.1 bifunctional DedA family/phosphatase PAP2 family protein [Hahella sp. HNIBRBA332]